MLNRVSFVLELLLRNMKLLSILVITVNVVKFQTKVACHFWQALTNGADSKAV